MTMETQPAPPPRPNHLSGETSPYLRQHMHNPVDWYPWGGEALARARKEDKPVFLSIGYSACHWCHVMERESFENPQIAAFLNAHFVSIKVDREERPDVDNIYMDALHAMGEHGGWPLTMFLTPDLKPFYGGTYYPPRPSYGRPSFSMVLERVLAAFKERRAQIGDVGAQIGEHLRKHLPPAPDFAPHRRLLEKAYFELESSFDSRHGGFGGAPKFPRPDGLELLLQISAGAGEGPDGAARALQMVDVTLKGMAAGGIYDHIGGGFARYSTDPEWLVPHFEKMLYDNALLASVYLHAFQLRADAGFARVARETLDWVLRDMTCEEGAFAAALDADSEGEEGKFYVWRDAEVREHLTKAEADVFIPLYGLAAGENFEGANILFLEEPLEVALGDPRRAGAAALVASARAKLLAVRNLRVWPGKDDKILAAWNGMIITALAAGYRILGGRRYLDAARRAMAYVLGVMRDGPVLFRTAKGKQAKYPAYLEDYAHVAEALLALYESDFDATWLAACRELVESAIHWFHDAEHGGFFFTGAEHRDLIARQKPSYDGATPSGNSTMAGVLQRLECVTGDERYGALARETLRAFGTQLERAPGASGRMLQAVAWELGAPCAIVVAGGDPGHDNELLRAAWAAYRPFTTVQWVPAAGASEQALRVAPLLQEKRAGPGEAVAFVCRHGVCGAPARTADELRAQLQTNQ